ncbi:MAG: hypothetical protein QOG87_3537, partial [Actinomycetota bacterium]
MSPTARAAILVALVAAAALVLPPVVCVLAMVVIVAATIVDARAVRGAPAGERTISAILSRGVRSPVSVDVDAAPVVVRQAVPVSLGLDPDTADGALRGDVLPLRRGRVSLPAATARVTGPLGLARW